MPRGGCFRSTGGVLLIAASACAQSFVNWESPHVHPMDMTPNAARLLAVNTADNRLEVYDITGQAPIRIGAVAVGLDPVSVRARSNNEAWVVNHLSDSVSIVDLNTMNVRMTLHPGDEPADVVFALGRAFVSVSRENLIRVYDADNPAEPPITVPIDAEEPRALATDGTTVYAAIFESGNRTTIVPRHLVSDGALNPYPGDPNPPPNVGGAFVPAISPGLPTPPQVGIIVRWIGSAWRDDNNANWSPAVTWGLHDRDLASIDADRLDVSYRTGLMNTNMAIACRPDGSVTVVGTDALNHRRFVPNYSGRFLRVNMASVSPGPFPSISIVDLNPHLTYSNGTGSPELRQQSLGDPRAIVWTGDGEIGYVAGMGSGNIAVIAPSGQRLGLIEVGASSGRTSGPTGLALDEASQRLYVLNRFQGSLEVIDTSANASIGIVPFFDPTPGVIRAGRPHLFDTRRTSGLGHASCASCHIDGRSDHLAWDMGDPSGAEKSFSQVCGFGSIGEGVCEDWHPMKGPMMTQSLFGIFGIGPLHWRGDRANLAAFNPAFAYVQSSPNALSEQEMAELTAYAASLTMPPNPYLNMDGSLRLVLPNGGDPSSGAALFKTAPLHTGTTSCVECHSGPAGTSGVIVPRTQIDETQSMRVPQLRGLIEKTGFDPSNAAGGRGFGFTHDGSEGSIFSYLNRSIFVFPSGETGDQQRRDLEAYLWSFQSQTHAGVGVQTTLVSLASATPAQVELMDRMLTLADTPAVGLVVKGVIGGEARGYAYIGAGMHQSDRAAETVTDATLRLLADAGAELTWTLVPFGSQQRIGIDRDEDGHFDRDEIDAGSDPADSSSVPPPPPCMGDADEDGVVTFSDITAVLANWGASYSPGQRDLGDANHDGVVDFADVTSVLARWGSVCR